MHTQYAIREQILSSFVMKKYFSSSLFGAFALLALILSPLTLLSCPSPTVQVDAPAWVKTARSQIGVTTSYDGSYVSIAYPNGDVPKETGVCTDVVIRAFRPSGLDLQSAVHQDMKANFNVYPKMWGLKTTDKNIDHRRVPNLACYFKRQGWAQPITDKAENYKAGDIICWDLGGGNPHIGIVSEQTSLTGTPLIIHNIGSGAKEDNCLFDFKITEHFRPKLPLK